MSKYGVGHHSKRWVGTMMRLEMGMVYRVIQQLLDQGWVDFNFGSSSACQILLLLMRDVQNVQSS